VRRPSFQFLDESVGQPLSDIEINAAVRNRLVVAAGSNWHHRRRLFVFDKTGGLCWHCCATLGSDWHVDHLHPRAAGGTNDRANLVPSCRPCNMEKLDYLGWEK
jgi:5-methylcytosine-specific restriction endonuclease McrA